MLGAVHYDVIKWKHFPRYGPVTRALVTNGCTSNYANPVYGVATICHQVRWLRWGHPSLFHTATSLLIWYEMLCVGDISYRIIWMEFINAFSVYAQSWTHSRFNWSIIMVLTYNSSVVMCVEITDAPKLYRKCAETWAVFTVSGQWPLG